MCSTDLMLPGVVERERGGDTVEGLEKGQTCAVALVGNRYWHYLKILCYVLSSTFLCTYVYVWTDPLPFSLSSCSYCSFMKCGYRVTLGLVTFMLTVVVIRRLIRHDHTYDIFFPLTVGLCLWYSTYRINSNKLQFCKRSGLFTIFSLSSDLKRMLAYLCVQALIMP